MDPLELQRAARRAYEGGRLRLGLRAAIFVLPVVALGMWANGDPTVALIAGALLCAGLCFLSWRGQALGAAVLPGLLSGVAPLSISGIARTSHACAPCDIPFAYCFTATLAGGVLAGVVLTLAASRISAERRWIFLVAGSGIAGLVGAMGCVAFGLSGLLGLGVGLIGLSGPAMVRAFTVRHA